MTVRPEAIGGPRDANTALQNDVLPISDMLERMEHQEREHAKAFQRAERETARPVAARGNDFRCNNSSRTPHVAVLSGVAAATQEIRKNIMPGIAAREERRTEIQQGRRGFSVGSNS